MAGGPFSQELFAFLAELRENNDREWFAANRPQAGLRRRLRPDVRVGDAADALPVRGARSPLLNQQDRSPQA
jgi:uncharacterized protein (DUF2461 family)